ncbi:MAG TPA: alpha/beta hydrolase, partial [Cyclobacteriaceae bacterium]
MQRIPHTVQFKNAILHYDVTGNGEKTLLLFHGFGQNKTSFYELAEVLADRYTLYIVDLFFHGESEWPYGEQPLEKEFWREILEAFFRKHQI